MRASIFLAPLTALTSVGAFVPHPPAGTFSHTVHVTERRRPSAAFRHNTKKGTTCPPFRSMNRFCSTGLYASAIATEVSTEVSSMKASDIRKELESYGISTKSFFEKSELVEALEKARAEGRKPMEPSEYSYSSPSPSPSASSASSSSTDGISREEKIKAEMEKCSKMKVGELKKELQGLGVSTKSFFEKSEFVKALAEARIDGVKKSAGGRGSAWQQAEEDFDPSYRDATVQKFNYDPRDPCMRGPIIDVRSS